MNTDGKNLRILICIGGGPAAYTGLRFAARLNRESCADISLMYVRPLDSGLKSGGLEVRVARENVLGWGLELPGPAPPQGGPGHPPGAGPDQRGRGRRLALPRPVRGRRRGIHPRLPQPLRGGPSP